MFSGYTLQELTGLAAQLRLLKVAMVLFANTPEKSGVSSEINSTKTLMSVPVHMSCQDFLQGYYYPAGQLENRDDAITSFLNTKLHFLFLGA
jgi:hypothetical protein